MPSPNLLAPDPFARAPHPVKTGNADAPPAERRPRRPFPFGKAILIAVVLSISLFLAPFVIAGTRGILLVRDAKAQAAALRADLEGRDFVAAKGRLDGLERTGLAAKSTIAFFAPLRDVPALGLQIRNAEEVLAASLALVAPVREFLGVAAEIQEIVGDGGDAWSTAGLTPEERYASLSPEQKRAIVARFSEALPRLRVARERLVVAAELWRRVDVPTIPAPARSAIAPLAAQIPKLVTALDQAIPLLEVMVPFAGYPTPQRYVFLLQNRDEIRPAGGFIGNIGTATLDGGELRDFDVQDVYHLDGPVHDKWKEPLPAPMAKYLGVKAWYFRDANWSPDFPTSAKTLMDFYVRERAMGGTPVAEPPTVLVAFQPDVFEALLTLTGPITVRGKTFDRRNVFDLLQYEVEVGFAAEGIPLRDRKGLVEDLGKALVERLAALPASRWPEALDIVTRALDRKQIQMYAADPQLLALLDARGWTGRTKATNGDFLWVVDANLAALKTDGVMEKHVDYRVDLKAARPTATVTLTYRNTNPKPTWRYTRYRSYTRIYVPEGAEFVSADGGQGAVDVTRELGKTVFGTFWVVEPGKTGSLTFRYALPASVSDRAAAGTYRLDWMKQAGNDQTSYGLSVALPRGVKTANPPEDEERWGDLAYQVESDALKDRVFEVGF